MKITHVITPYGRKLDGPRRERWISTRLTKSACIVLFEHERQFYTNGHRRYGGFVKVPFVRLRITWSGSTSGNWNVGLSGMGRPAKNIKPLWDAVQ